MDHGVPVDPKNGCGTAGQYFNDVGVCSAAMRGGRLGADRRRADGRRRRRWRRRWRGGGGSGGGGGGGGSGGGGTGGWGGGGNWVTPGAATWARIRCACGGCSAAGVEAIGGALPIALVIVASRSAIGAAGAAPRGVIARAARSPAWRARRSPAGMVVSRQLRRPRLQALRAVDATRARRCRSCSCCTAARRIPISSPAAPT